MSIGAGSSEYGPDAPTGLKRWYLLALLAFVHAPWANVAIKAVLLAVMGFLVYYTMGWMQSPIAPDFFAWLCPLIIFGLGWTARWIYES